MRDLPFKMTGIVFLPFLPLPHVVEEIRGKIFGVEEFRLSLLLLLVLLLLLLLLLERKNVLWQMEGKV